MNLAPGHCKVPGNETVDGLAKKAASTMFIGPEPVFGVPMCSKKERNYGG